MLADFALSLQSRHLESLVHLGLDGIWRAQTYWETNEGKCEESYKIIRPRHFSREYEPFGEPVWGNKVLDAPA